LHIIHIIILLAETAQEEKMKRQLELEQKLEDDLLEQQLTGGIACASDLTALPDTLGAEDDRVILPQTFFEELNRQDAFPIGPAFFQLTAKASGRVTHCGVREFTAAEDSVVLPQKVVDSLFGSVGLPTGQEARVTIKYIRLPKVTHVKLQPLENNFYGLENMKLMLEDNLKHHSTLTVGDVVTVWHRGHKYTLRVSTMLPAQMGTLIDTDVEVDLDESVEWQEHVRHTAAAEALTAPVSHVLGGAATIVTSANSATSAAGVGVATVPSTATAASAGVGSVFKFPTTSQATPSIQGPSIPVPAEPELGAEGVINSKFRIAGGNLTRRFLKSDHLRVLFAYLRSEACSGANSQLSSMCTAGNVLQLTTRFPSRVITETDDAVVGEGMDSTLELAGIISPIDFIVGMVS
jgi:hypothetical protein